MSDKNENVYVFVNCNKLFYSIQEKGNIKFQRAVRKKKWRIVKPIIYVNMYFNISKFKYNNVYELMQNKIGN